MTTTAGAEAHPEVPAEGALHPEAEQQAAQRGLGEAGLQGAEGRGPRRGEEDPSGLPANASRQRCREGAGEDSQGDPKERGQESRLDTGS